MKERSSLFRWTVLVASLVTMGFLIAAAVRENYFQEWRRIQRSYRNILKEKAADERGRDLARNFRVELRQVSVPELGVVDRCVTCHVGIDDPRMVDVSPPFAAHPGGILEQHPVDRFGCTICHNGQGAAVNFHDAKGADVYWDYPLLTAELTQSSCPACHDPVRLPRNSAKLLLDGMNLYREKGCGSCHKLAGRGGTLGPALDDEGAKTRHQLIMTNLDPPYVSWRWHEAHFKDPGGVVAGSQMKNPTVTAREASALTVYMLSLRQQDLPQSYLAPDRIEQRARDLHPGVLSGEEAYRQYCFSCHGSGGFGRWDKTFRRFIPAIRGPSLLLSAEAAYLESNIAKGRPGTLMPSWEAGAGGLAGQEIVSLAEYLRRDAQGAPALEPSPGRGDAGRGASIYVSACAGCHGPAGKGGIAPELANPTFQQAASDDFIATTIRRGRRDTAMASFQSTGAAGLSDAQIGDLVAFIRTLAGGERRGAGASELQNKRTRGAP